MGTPLRSASVSPYSADSDAVTLWSTGGVSSTTASGWGPRPGAATAAIRATTLTHEDIRGHDTFERPDAVRPVTSTGSAGGPTPAYDFPAASVTALEVALA